MKVKHPARFSPAILETIKDYFERFGWPQLAIDPFVGTGRIFEITRLNLVGVELEPEWAAQADSNAQLASIINPQATHAVVQANTLQLPFPDDTFDALVTSPCYGNRMADHHNAMDGSLRRSYKHDLGRDPHPESSCTLQWGESYRNFHDAAWTECLRVLQRDALIVLNISNHIRNFQEQRVAEWHMNWFMDHGCAVEDFDLVKTPRMRQGENSKARTHHEYVFVMRYQFPEVTDVEDGTIEDAEDRPTHPDTMDTREGSGSA